MEKSIKRYTDLLIWQRSKDLSVQIYRLTAHLKDFDFRSQIRRASISTPSNISEGFTRGTNKEFRYFLNVARGSINEVQNLLIIGSEIGLIPDSTALISECEQISKMILSFIRKIEPNKW